MREKSVELRQKLFRYGIYGEPSAEYCLLKLFDIWADLHENQVYKDGFSDIKKIKTGLIDYLKNFHATGYDMSVDANVGFIVDTQNPLFDVTYMNKYDNKKITRRYRLIIQSVNLGLEFAIRCNLYMKISGGEYFNYYDTDGVIDLGLGVNVGVLFVNLVYFKLGMERGDCSVWIAGIPMGWSSSLGVIFGGIMKPVKRYRIKAIVGTGSNEMPESKKRGWVGTLIGK